MLAEHEADAAVVRHRCLRVVVGADDADESIAGGCHFADRVSCTGNHCYAGVLISVGVVDLQLEVGCDEVAPVVVDH